MATFGLLAPISQLFPVDEAISSVVLLVGLAVGVDYSMFYLRRERAERRAGHSNEKALEIAAATSGRAVLVSGLTVMIAMAGMFLTANATFMSFALGTIVVVGVAVLGSLTVLPAVLSKLGDKVEKGRVPFVHRLRRGGDGESRVWSAILDRVLRRPLVSALVAGGLLVAMAIPALHMETKDPDPTACLRTWRSCRPTTGSRRRSRVSRCRPWWWSRPTTSATRPSAPRSTTCAPQAIDTGLMNDPVDVTVNDRGDVGVVTIPMVGSGTDDEVDRGARRRCARR